MHQVAVAQIRALCRRQGPRTTIPLFLVDAGYDPVPLTLALAEEPVAILVRLRNDRCCFGEQVPRAQGERGAPRRQGAKCDGTNPATWPPPRDAYQTEDGQYGTVRVRAWARLHGRPTRQVGRDHGRQPLVAGTVVLVEVTRLPGRTRKPQGLWLWWAGPGSPDLALLWRAWVRR
jgi:hypothetical protein